MSDGPDVIVVHIEDPLLPVVVTVAPTALAGPPGASAYELGVQGGYQGILEEWLDSLRAGGSPPTLTAGATLSGHRAVVPAPGDTVVYADHTHLADLGRPVWLTLGAATEGAPVDLAWAGTVVESSWAWTVGPVFIGADGLLTQSAPTTGYTRQLGTAMSTDTLWLDPQPGIALT